MRFENIRQIFFNIQSIFAYSSGYRIDDLTHFRAFRRSGKKPFLTTDAEGTIAFSARLLLPCTKVARPSIPFLRSVYPVTIYTIFFIAIPSACIQRPQFRRNCFYACTWWETGHVATISFVIVFMHFSSVFILLYWSILFTSFYYINIASKRRRIVGGLHNNHWSLDLNILYHKIMNISITKPPRAIRLSLSAVFYPFNKFFIVIALIAR